MAEPSSSRPVMPGYGLAGPNEGQGLLPWSWAEERLRESRNFWLATHWPDGRPHVMPVWAVWHEEGLWFSSSKGSRKARNLAADPRCVLTTEDSQNPVVVEASVTLLTAAHDLAAFLELVNTKYRTTYGPEMVDTSANCTFRARPTWAFGLRAAEFTRTPTRWLFSPP